MFAFLAFLDYSMSVPNLDWFWPLIVVLEFEIVVLEKQN